MKNRSLLVKVPATVGNFGGAQKCAALALDSALNVKVTPRMDGRVGIRYFGENGERVPRDRTNLVVRSMEAALHLAGREFHGADYEIYSSVPVAVGLGSSTAAVLAGLIAADSLYGLDLDEKTILDLASIYESRADNLRAAWFGGFVVCGEESGNTVCRRTLVPPSVSLSVVAPEAPLTSGRTIAPDPGHEGAQHARRASALAEYFSMPARKMLKDFEVPLPPTCEKQVPGMEDALRVQAPGLLLAFVCGSGPAVGILAQDDPEEAIGAVRACFRKAGVSTTFGTFRPANSGARDWNAVRAEVVLPFRSSSRADTTPQLH